MKSDCRVVAVIRRLHIRISRPGFQKWAKRSMRAGVVCGGDPAVQYHHLDGQADAECVALFRPVRARGHRRAHPRQNCSLQAQGHVDGGVPPLGYEVRERRLVINPTEADTARYIYQRYLELGCVRQLSRELDERGIVSKVQISKKGIKSGGCRFSRGALYELLANPIQIGEIRHKQECYPGQHQAIVPRELWERVQHRLRVNAARGRQSSTSAITSPLAGKIFDADGEPLRAQGAAKAGRRYQYYVSRSLVNGSSSDDTKGWRLAAPELERAVAIATRHILSDRAGMLEMLERSGLQSPDVRTLLNRPPLFPADWKAKPISRTAWSSSSTGSNCATTAYG